MRTEGSLRSEESCCLRSPDLNPFRHPLWGRGQEVPSEDPLLCGRYGAGCKASRYHYHLDCILFEVPAISLVDRRVRASGQGRPGGAGLPAARRVAEAFRWLRHGRDGPSLLRLRRRRHRAARHWLHLRRADLQPAQLHCQHLSAGAGRVLRAAVQARGRRRRRDGPDVYARDYMALS